MIEERWIEFHRGDPKSYPPPDAEVIVQTERGQIFNAKFVEHAADFSLRYALWGNQGAVTRWKQP